MWPISLALPDAKAKKSAKNGVMPNRAAVMWNDEVPSKAYLEKAVDIPQPAAAPIANNAAMAVPVPVEKLIPPCGKAVKYAAAKAMMLKAAKRRVSGSRSKTAEAAIAKIGFNCCKRITTENGMY